MLIAREKPERDGAIPSGNSVEALNLLRLYEYTTDEKYHEQALMIFASSHGALEQNPSSVSELLLAFDYFQDEPFDIVIIQPETGGNAEPMLAALRDTFVPNRVLSVVARGPSRKPMQPSHRSSRDERLEKTRRPPMCALTGFVHFRPPTQKFLQSSCDKPSPSNHSLGNSRTSAASIVEGVAWKKQPVTIRAGVDFVRATNLDQALRGKPQCDKSGMRSRRIP